MDVIPAKAGIQFAFQPSGHDETRGKIKMDPGFRRDDVGYLCRTAVDHGCTTVIEAGIDLPTPRISGRYMSSTSGGGTV